MRLDVLKGMTGLMLVFSPVCPAFGGSLTAAEIQQIESDLGITLSQQEIDDLGALVKPDTIDPWRSAAEARIDTHRKAGLSILVEDSAGTPVSGAQVAVSLKRNAFKFGGVANAVDFTDANNNLAANGQTSAYWKRVTTNLFNAIGFNNAFKPKITSQHQYIPAITNWASANGLDMRAHLLIWPGGGDLGDLSGTPGIDYGSHLSRASTSAFASYNVLGAVETYAASAQGPGDKAALKAVVDAEIAEWAGRWNVYEWDVINETRGNNLLQQILGYDQEAEWFNIASNHMVDPEAKLFINENQIISAKSEALQSGYYTARRDIYYATIDQLIAGNAPIHGVGFQNRYKWEHIDPADVYSRLDEFGTRYGLQMAGTEFEIKDQSPFIPGEYLRAQMTEETLTVYYSHALATGLNAWDYMEGDISSLCYYDGTIKLNGLVWYYVNRIRYNTETNETTDLSGAVSVDGHKGEYNVTVSYGGTDYPATVTLTSNQTAMVTLEDVTITPSPNPPVFVTDPVIQPNATQDIAYTGQSITNSATDADGDPITYAKVQGPAWLSIAANGDLSGTPSGSDTGANSWIIEASDGINTTPAVLRISVDDTGGGGGYAGISVVDTDSDGFSSGTGAATGFISTSVSAQTGDKIVVVTSTNKKGSVQPLTLVQTGGGGVTGPQTELTNLMDTYPTSWGWYMTVTAPGTFSYEVRGSNITAGATVHLLRGAAGQVALEDHATWDDPDNADNGTSYALDYTFGGSLPDGVVIEAISARTDLITEPAAYTVDFNGAGKRVNTHFDGVTGSSLTSAYTLSGGTADRQTSGALGLVFVGTGAGGGNTPPVFTSDPITEAAATQDIAYSGATLADHAFDADTDPMTFGLVTGPEWLIVAPGGALSGTPAPEDLGANTWKVFVTDGTVTNFAGLEIEVVEPLPPPVSPQNGTNVLFIAIDDMKPLLGCYGDALAISPNIDTLAGAGITFLNAQCQWAVCGPSRASISAGLYPEETGVMGFRKMRGLSVDGSRDNAVIRPNLVTLQQWFRYNGYRTAATGKINDPRCVGSMDMATGKINEDGRTVDDPPSWGDPVNPYNLPADLFTSSSYVDAGSGWSPGGNPSVASNDAPDSAFTDGMICDEGIGLMQGLAAGDTRFFLGVGFKKPHLPFVAPQQYWDLYDRGDIEIAPFQAHPLHEVPYSWNYANELVNYDDIADVRDANGLLLVPEAKQKELIHGYYACASFIDAQIGRLLDELETLGLHTNTIVVVWGDHGFHLGDHSEWAKHTNLEQAARVPLVIYSPFTGTAGSKTEAPAAFVDIYPTLCELAGLSVPEQPLGQNEDPFAPASGRAIKGLSLVPVMQDTDAPLRTGALTVFNRSGARGYAYRTERYRYIEWIDNGGVVARELYDYELDPLETVNLAGEPGFDALMYQYSVSMRAELDALGLSGSDIACDDLQGSPAYDTTGGSLLLPGLSSVLIGTDFEVSWPAAAGWTYNIVTKTNLTDAAWQLQQGGVSGDVFSVPADKPAAFYGVELND
jgi:arylsulfatase A-like enzyme/GH35 family endo-1,4-beta-xylanase